MKIVIPTYQRAHRIAINGGTLYALREVLGWVTLVVRPEEAEAYSKFNVALDVLPSTVKDLGATRQYIWDKYSKTEDYFCMMDDDVQYFNKQLRARDFPAGTFELKKPDQIWVAPQLKTREDFVEMFDELQRELESGSGMTSPRPNWAFPDANDKCYPRRSTGFCTGFWTFNAKLLRDKNMRFDRWVSAGDIDFNYQILAMGIDTPYCSNYKYNIDLMCVSSEVHKNEVREYREFMAAWPDFVKKRKASHKGSIGYGYAPEGRGSLIYHKGRLLKHARASQCKSSV